MPDQITLRSAATAVAQQIEQTIAEVQCSLVWNNSEADRLGFKLPGPHTVGFLLRTFYSDGDEFRQLIPLAKDVVKDPTLWPQCLLTVTKYWLAALQNEQERLRPLDQPKAAPQWEMVTCAACSEKILYELMILARITHCSHCGAAYPAQPKRGQP